MFVRFVERIEFRTRAWVVSGRLAWGAARAGGGAGGARGRGVEEKEKGRRRQDRGGAPTGGAPTEGSVLQGFTPELSGPACTSDRPRTPPDPGNPDRRPGSSRMDRTRCRPSRR